MRVSREGLSESPRARGEEPVVTRARRGRTAPEGAA